MERDILTTLADLSMPREKGSFSVSLHPLDWIGLAKIPSLKDELSWAFGSV